MSGSVGKGTPKNITVASIGVNNVTKEIVNGWVGTATTPKLVYTAGGGGGGGNTLAVQVNPSSAGGTTQNANEQTVTTNSVTATASGGSAPYSWAITKVIGDTISPTNPNPANGTTASTAFSSSVAPFESKSATYRFTVTDSTSATASVSLSVSVVNDGPPN